MAEIQTTIGFVTRKKILPVYKKRSEKENNHKTYDTPLKSPSKIQERILLHSNSPIKRKLSEDDQFPITGSSAAKRATPSTLFRKLTLQSVPNNIPTLSPKPSPRKELFPSDDSNLRHALKALHSSLPSSLPCREDKLTQLRTFLELNLNETTGSSIYISGPPGTGKTASLNLIIRDTKFLSRIKIININCTAIKSSVALYSRVAEELKIKVTSPKTEKKYLNAIEKYITSCQSMVLLVLDELDQLESRKQSVLYTVFEWPSLKGSRLILVGIANALDLTDRVLPRLQAKVKLKPQLLHFPPYTREEIIEIMTNRLNEAGVNKIIEPRALQLLAGKVASVSGDLRRALDIARRVIEYTYDQRYDLKTDGLDEMSVAIGIKQVMDIVNNVYGTSQTLSKTDEDDNSDSFPLQQKLLICSVLLHLKYGKSKDINVAKLHEVYSRICEKRNLVSVDVSEFISLVSLIESRGILRLQGKVKNRLSKISLQWDEQEMVSALQDKKLVAAILEDKSFIK